MRCPLSASLLNTSASSRPMANVMTGTNNANAKFQTRILKNDPVMTGLVKMSTKFLKPTPTFQPWASRLPFGSTKAPVSLSAV